MLSLISRRLKRWLVLPLALLLVLSWRSYQIQAPTLSPTQVSERSASPEPAAPLGALSSPTHTVSPTNAPTERPTATSTTEPTLTPVPSPTASPPLSPSPSPSPRPLPSAVAPTPTPRPTNTPPTAAGDAVTPPEGAHPSAHPGVEPVVLANYFPWYDPQTWETGCTSAGDLPQGGAYQSDDPAVIAEHVGQARAANLDGFAVHWYAPGNRTDTNFNQLLNQSPGGFRSTVTFLRHILPGASQQDVIEALRYVIDTYGHHPRFFRAADKPVIMFSDMYRVPGGQDTATAVAQWRAIRQAVDPGHTTWWIAEGLEPAYLAVFDGLYVYKIDHACCPNAYQSAPQWASWVTDWEGRTGQPKLWVGTVMPGWNDLNSAQAQCTDLRVSSQPFARDRADGAYYNRTWEAVLPTAPDFIVVHSFNEWVEGSYIEPSVQFGDFYLQLTAQWTTRFKHSR